MMARRLADERGVAAVTVMLVTSVLAAAGAVVAFTATAELEIAGRDRRAEGAFAVAEAGLDQGASHLLQNPSLPQGQSSECLNNALMPDESEHVDAVGRICGVSITSPTGGQLVYPLEGRPFVEYTVVSRAQEGRTVTRTLAATYRLEALELPFGMFVNRDITLTGNAKLHCESLLVNGNVYQREKLNTDCNGDKQFNDPDLAWRFHKDVINSDPAPAMCADGTATVGCAAVYANYQIFQKEQGDEPREIHTDPKAAKYPHDRDIHQTKLDSQGKELPIVSLPTDRVLEAMGPLEDVARAQSLYFDFRNGQAETVDVDPPYIGAGTGAGGPRNFARNVVVYIDADPDDQVFWKVDLIPGDPSSEVGYVNADGVRVGSDSGVIVMRGGNLAMESNTRWSGAVFVPEGKFQILGGTVCTCTVYADSFSVEGGTSTVQLTADWFSHPPAGFFSALRTAFLECEPFQDYTNSDVCPQS